MRVGALSMVTVLVFIVLAKLSAKIISGVSPNGSACVKRCACRGLKWPSLKRHMPRPIAGCSNEAVDIEQFEQVVAQFFKAQPKQVAACISPPSTVRHCGPRIPAGRTHGLHLLAAYLPEKRAGWCPGDASIEVDELQRSH